jgi:hypothetical protein
VHILKGLFLNFTLLESLMFFFYNRAMINFDKIFRDLIDSIESSSDIVPLPPLSSPWQNENAKEAAPEETREIPAPQEPSAGENVKEPVLTKLLKQLNHNNKQTRREAARGLGILKNPGAVLPLIHALKDTSLFVQREAALALGIIGDARAMEPLRKFLEKYDDQYFREALNMITAILEHRDLQSFCMACFCRATAHTITLPGAFGITYYACHACHGNRSMKHDVRKVTLCLDHSFSRPFTFKRNHLTIDWFQRKHALDCDEISIIDAREHEVEEMVMKFRNDMDHEHRKALKKIPVLLSPQLTLSEAKQNLLRDIFMLKGV